MISTRFLPISWTSPFTVASSTLPRAGLAAMLGDGSDVPLINRRLLPLRLLPPIFGRGAEIFVSGIDGWRVEQQTLGETALFFGDRREALKLLGIDNREIEPRLRA